MGTRVEAARNPSRVPAFMVALALLFLIQLMGILGVTGFQKVFAANSSQSTPVVIFHDDSYVLTSEGSQPIRLLGGTRDFASGTDIQPGLAYLPRQVSTHRDVRF